MGNEDSECRHVVNRDRLGNRRRKGLSEKRDTSLGLTSIREKLSLERVIFLGHKEGGCAQGSLSFLLGRDLLISRVRPWIRRQLVGRDNYLMVQELLHVIDSEEMLAVHGDDNSVPDLGNKDLGLVLDLHVRSSEDLGIDTLRQPRKDVPPGSPDGDTQVERSGNRKYRIPDDVPQVSIQKEQDQIREVHQTKNDHRLVLAQQLCRLVLSEERLPDTVVNLHGRKDTDGIPERQSQEEVRLNELGTKNKDPDSIGHPHVVALQVRETGGERLTGDIATRVLRQIASKQPTKRHDREEEIGEDGDEELDNSENQGNLAALVLARAVINEEDIHAGGQVDDEDQDTEQKTFGEMLSSSPCTRNISPLTKGRKYHDERCNRTTETDRRPSSCTRGLIVETLPVIVGVQRRGVESRVKPVSRDVNNPDTIEVGDQMEPRTRLLVRLEEDLLPFDFLELRVSLRCRNIAEQGLVGEDDPLDTLGVPEELIDIVVSDDILVILLPTDVLTIHDFVALVAAILVQRGDDITEISSLLNRLNALLALGRMEVVLGTLEDEAETFRHESNLVGLTPAEEEKRNLPNTLMLRHPVHLCLPAVFRCLQAVVPLEGG